MGVLEIVVVVLLVLLNGFFAMSELAIVSARQGRLERLAAGGSAGASAALSLAKDPGRFLAATQFGMTLTGILAGAFSGATLADKSSSGSASIRPSLSMPSPSPSPSSSWR